ncbi:C6 transcription factor [Colletotrichum scovillei]|nr:C6 transcription factor [Colletotrichum scovillei]KAF4778757.1 C6 transcription factor [Colletotrichum scovillei]
MIDQATGSEESSPAHTGNSPLTVQAQHPELEGRSLPSTERILKLLRLCQTEKQRFFIDVPVIDEQEFGEYCQKVCFAITDFSSVDWIIVNAGLFFLLQGLKPHHYAIVGFNELDIEAYSQLLKANLEAAIQSLRLCSDPSIQACQALAVLYTFCNKTGQSTLAWQLISAASRMCIDLGWHRLPSNEPEFSKRRQVFWHVYVHDKSMAFTMGRTPSIPPYDVSTERPSIPKDCVPGVPVHLYSGFVEYAFIVGDMHVELFSASAFRQPLETRSQRAKSVVCKLLEVNTRIRQSIKHNPPDDDLYKALAVLLDFMMYGLVTIAYRVIPRDEGNDSPLKCSSECTEAARNALRTIVRAFESWGHLRITGWSMLLNMMFSLVPFASFIVLAGHTVATASEEDLTLLCSAVTAIEPTSSSSPSAKKLYDVCKTFYELASFSTKRRSLISKKSQHSEQVYEQREIEDIPSLPDVNFAAPPYDHIMAPQDWDAVMNEIDLGTGVSAMASFVEPYIPFDGRLP